MDFRELTYITAVADEQSVTAAAKKLYISQPSLSYIISKVEQDLGVKLFDRKTNPLSLTYAGEKYVQTAREILLMRDNVRRELSDIGHGAKGRVNIGIPNERAGYMLPRAIPIFRSGFPGVEIRIEESRSDELIRNLMIDRIGFCVMPIVEEELPPGLITENAIAEMTPGPLGINCATFTGNQTAGPLGGIIAVLGVLTPAFTLTLLVAIFFEKCRDSAIMKTIMRFVKPVCIALLLGVLVTLGRETFFSNGALLPFSILISILMFVLLLKYKWTVPKVIGASALLGIFFYGVLPMIQV